MLSLHIQLEPVLKSIDTLNTSGLLRDSRVKYKFIIHQTLSSASPSSLLKRPNQEGGGRWIGNEVEDVGVDKIYLDSAIIVELCKEL